MYYGPDGPHSISDYTTTTQTTQTTQTGPTTQTTQQTGPTTQTTQTGPTITTNTEEKKDTDKSDSSLILSSYIEQLIEKEKKKAKEAQERAEEEKKKAEEKKIITKNELEADPNYWLNKRDAATTYTKEQLQQELNNAESDWSKKAWTSQREKDALEAKIEALKKALEPQENVPQEVEEKTVEPEDKNTTNIIDDTDINKTTADIQKDKAQNPLPPVGPSSHTSNWDPEKELETQKKHLEEMEKRQRGGIAKAEPLPEPNPEPDPTPDPEPEKEDNFIEDVWDNVIDDPEPDPEPEPEPTPTPTPDPEPEPIPEPEPEPTPEPEPDPEPEQEEEQKQIEEPTHNFDPTAQTTEKRTTNKGNYDNMYLIGSGNYNKPNGTTNYSDRYAVDYSTYMPNIGN